MCSVFLVTLMIMTSSHVVLTYPLFALPDPPQLNTDLVETPRLIPKRSTLEKRRHPPGVDVWQLCPHTMAQTDCFYTYLRVYARLRKGARNVDPIHMRNIGKRSSDLKPEPSLNNQITINCPDTIDYYECYMKTRLLAKTLFGLYEKASS